MPPQPPRTTPVLQVPQAAEYALRVAVCLAHATASERVSREALVGAVNLPPAYAAKVLRKLVVAGLVEAQRGWHGGFHLARLPQHIRVLDVMAAVGVEPELEHCAFGFDACDVNAPCPLHFLWRDLHDRLHAWATQTTLHALATNPDVHWPRCPGPPRSGGGSAPA